MEAQFITKKPKHSLLQHSISYYYFHRSEHSQKTQRFLYYPNFKNALTIYKNSRIVYEPGHSQSIPDKGIDFSYLYSGVQTQCRSTEIISPFDKIGIVFQPLGIQNYIRVPLSQLSNDPINKAFPYLGDTFKTVCQQVYDTDCITTKVMLLDRYFLEHYQAFSNDRLEQAILYILKASHKITVKELAQQLDISTKTLSRLFLKHLCCTTKDYIQIVQFRNALDTYLLDNTVDSLTALAMDHQYYDQAQFIKHFKKLTGINPKLFFKNVQHLGLEDTFWMMNPS